MDEKVRTGRVVGQPGPNVVCHQSEWDAIEQAQPGLHRLIRGGITNEGEAERLARGSSGDDRRAARKKAILEILDAAPGCAIEPDDEARGSDVQEDDGPLLLPFSALPRAIREPAVSDEPPAEQMESA